MKKDLIITSVAKIGYYLVLILGGLGSCAIGYYNLDISPAYPQLSNLAISTFLGIFGFIALYSILSEFSLKIYTDRLEVKTIFGFTKKTIKLDDILYWTEIEKETKYQKYQDLTIYTHNSKFTISSTIYNHHELIKNLLTKQKFRDKGKEAILIQKSKSRMIIGFCLVGSIFFLALSHHFYLKSDPKIYKFESAQLNQLVVKKIDVSKGKKGNMQSISIVTQQYPDFKFEIDKEVVSDTNFIKMLVYLETGSIINLEIDEVEFHKKIKKDLELSFWEKTVSYYFIDIRGLSDNKNNYLTHKDYCQYQLNSQKSPLYHFVFAALSFALVSIAIKTLVSYFKWDK
jgi:hypothetical protein